MYQIGNVLNGYVVDRDVHWLIVYDQHGQPIAALEQASNDHVLVITCSDEKFHEVVKRYGVNKLPQMGVVRERA